MEKSGLSVETADVLRRCGVENLHDLIRVASQGDHNEELKNVGVSRLGPSAQTRTLAAPLQPRASTLPAAVLASDSSAVAAHCCVEGGSAPAGPSAGGSSPESSSSKLAGKCADGKARV